MKLNEIEPGTVVTVDGGFTCMPTGQKTVEANEHGELYVPCADGKHYLSGQADASGDLIGIKLAEAN